MRKGWALLALAVGVAACGGQYAVQEGGGGTSPTPTPTQTGSATPTPIASPPPFASYQTTIEPMLLSRQCGSSQVACHAPGTASGGVTVLQSTSPVPMATSQANYNQLACFPTLDAFNPPNGSLITNFCDLATGHALSLQHNFAQLNPTPTPFSDNDCATLIAWVTSGGSGTPPSCH